MLIIKYDSERGKVIPDGRVRGWADDVVKRHKSKASGTMMCVTVGSAIMVDALRVLVIKKELDHKEIVYRFKGLNLGASKDGDMPEGFCNVYDNILTDLFECPSRKANKKNKTEEEESESL